MRDQTHEETTQQADYINGELWKNDNIRSSYMNNLDESYIKTPHVKMMNKWRDFQYAAFQ